MAKCIIYNGENGRLQVLYPSPDCGLTVHQIALKDVPTGKPFKIIEQSDLPQDDAMIDALLVDDADLNDGFGADYGVGSENPFIMPGDWA